MIGIPAEGNAGPVQTGCGILVFTFHGVARLNLIARIPRLLGVGTIFRPRVNRSAVVLIDRPVRVHSPAAFLKFAHVNSFVRKLEIAGRAAHPEREETAFYPFQIVEIELFPARKLPIYIGCSHIFVDNKFQFYPCICLHIAVALTDIRFLNYGVAVIGGKFCHGLNRVPGNDEQAEVAMIGIPAEGNAGPVQTGCGKLVLTFHGVAGLHFCTGIPRLLGVDTVFLPRIDNCVILLTYRPIGIYIPTTCTRLTVSPTRVHS